MACVWRGSSLSLLLIEKKKKSICFPSQIENRLWRRFFCLFGKCSGTAISKWFPFSCCSQQVLCGCRKGFGRTQMQSTNCPWTALGLINACPVTSWGKFRKWCCPADILGCVFYPVVTIKATFLIYIFFMCWFPLTMSPLLLKASFLCFFFFFFFKVLCLHSSHM